MLRTSNSIMSVYGKTMVLLGAYFGSRGCNAGARGVATLKTVSRLHCFSQSTRYLQMNGQQGSNCMLLP